MIVLHTLGTAQIDVDGTPVLPTSPRRFALLLYLAVERGRGISRAALVDLVFPGQADAKNQHSLSETIYQCRQAGARIVSDANGVRLAPETVTSDYEAFINGETPSVASLAAIQRGLLPGYTGDHSAGFAAWLERLRGRVGLDLIKALKREIDGAKSVANWMLMEQAARASLSLDALNEDATFALAQIMAINGSKAQAMKLLDGYDAEVGRSSAELKSSSHLLRRRIRERLRDGDRAPAALPFLGRDSEMVALSERLELARGGQAQSVVIAGEAGIGKSRLAEEFCTKAILDGAVVAKTVAQPVDARRPMSVFVDLVPQLRELPGALGCSPDSLKTLNRLTVHDPDAHRDEPEQSSEYVWASIAQAIGELTDAITSEVPLIVFLDDAQWVDEVSLRALGALSTPRHSRRLLLLATSRDAQTSRLLSQRPSRSALVPLAGLTVAPIKEAVMRTLGGDDAAVDGRLLKWLSETSRGNPFFLQCLIGHYQATGQASGVPQSINALLDQQMGGLSPDAASMLRMIVTLGRHSDASRLLTALEMPQYQFQNTLHELERQRLVTMHGERVEAAHWLIADAAKRTNTPIVAKLMSRRVASLLESDAKETQSPSLLWDCAEKWVEAGDDAKAIDVMIACSAHSIEIGRPREAAEVLLRAASLSQSADAVRISREALRLADGAGEHDLVLRAIDGILTRAPDTDRQEFELAELHARVSEQDGSDSVTERLRAYLHSACDVSEKLNAAWLLLVHADQSGDVDLGKQTYAAFCSLDHIDDARNNILPTKLELVYHASFGDLDKARSAANSLLAEAARLQPAEAALLQRIAAVGLHRVGDVDASLEIFKAAYDNARTSGLRRLQARLAQMIVGRLLDQGELVASRECLEEVDEIASQLGDLSCELELACQHCEIACTLGDLAHAIRWFEMLKDFAARRAVTKKIARAMRASEIGIARLRGETIVPSRVVVALTGHHKLGAENGDVSDFEVAEAIRCCLVAGAADLARDVRNRYLSAARRARCPLSLGLKSAMAFIDAMEIQQTRHEGTSRDGAN